MYATSASLTRLRLGRVQTSRSTISTLTLKSHPSGNLRSARPGIQTSAADNFLGGEYVVNADVLYSTSSNSAMVMRGDLVPNGENAPWHSAVRAAFGLPSFVLTNSNEGNRSLTASFSVAKEYDNGFDWAFGYAYNDAEDVQPMTSLSVAFSNYNNRAVHEPAGRYPVDVGLQHFSSFHASGEL